MFCTRLGVTFLPFFLLSSLSSSLLLSSFLALLLRVCCFSAAFVLSRFSGPGCCPDFPPAMMITDGLKRKGCGKAIVACSIIPRRHWAGMFVLTVSTCYTWLYLRPHQILISHGVLKFCLKPIRDPLRIPYQNYYNKLWWPSETHSYPPRIRYQEDHILMAETQPAARTSP